uniref:substrate-binding periplasmic protein n=1 Tax=Castellaniella defragrans TaxID=75697 RepID=UPI003341C852
MRRPILGCLTWLMLVTAASAAPAAVTAPSADKPTILVCGHSNYPPVSWTEAGALHGAGPMLAQEILTRLGYPVQLLDIGNWKRCLYEVKAGRVDLVAGAFPNAQRSRDMVFVPEYVIEEPIILFTQRARPIHFSSLDDLRGKTVGLLLGDIYGEPFDSFLERNTHIEWVSTGAQNLGKLALGRIDFMPIGAFSGHLQASRLGLSEWLIPVSHVVSNGHFHFGIAHDSPLLADIDRINAEILRLRASGQIETLVDLASDDYLVKR